MTIPDVWARIIALFLAHETAGGFPATTLRARREHLEHLARRIGREPHEVTGEDLAAYAADQKWARETRRGRRATFRKFWGWALESGYVMVDASEALPKVRAGVANPRPCPDNAYKAALISARPRERLMLRLSAEMGLRRAEVAHIHARDIEDDLGGWSLIVHGKGAKDRTVPLPAGLARELIDACGTGYAFPGNDAGHLSPRWVGKLITRLLPEFVTMHALRHRFASRAWREGIDVFVIQSILGHASPETTRRYVALPRTAERAAIDRLAA
ncbi:tyrosine-type recombinase/integrase [Brevibacterium permense]|uniref:tyrosine-type recombinase/integrase n=1 Tax=Brevibacterium permense TaxID=234834 RepID=UPI0021D36902|nr:tyrosine-type recombinase/integrase [Brevibacterium permense]